MHRGSRIYLKCLIVAMNYDEIHERDSGLDGNRKGALGYNND